MKIDETISFLTESKKSFLQERIQQLLEKLNTIEYIILFGSYARGEERATSDMDLMVITENEVDRVLRGGLCSKFDEMHMDLIFYTLEKFKSSDCLLVNQVKQEGIVIWKRN
jgi:predicted nucleotidyltransferase